MSRVAPRIRGIAREVPGSPHRANIEVRSHGVERSVGLNRKNDGLCAGAAILRAARIIRAGACLASLGLAAGCGHLQALLHPTDPCYTESGWLDSSNGCSVYGDYPDCYLVCPRSGFRARVEDAAAIARMR